MRNTEMSIAITLALQCDLRASQDSRELTLRMREVENLLSLFIDKVEKVIALGVKEGAYMKAEEWALFSTDERSFVNTLIDDSGLRIDESKSPEGDFFSLMKAFLSFYSLHIQKNLSEIVSEIKVPFDEDEAAF